MYKKINRLGIGNGSKLLLEPAFWPQIGTSNLKHAYPYNRLFQPKKYPLRAKNCKFSVLPNNEYFFNR